MNWIGCYTLWRKEVARFGKVWVQTIGAPVLTALLYQLIFAHAVGRHAAPLPDIAYTVFLMPGLAMMSMTQNAFANTSSSLMQSRLTGNLVFILLPPLSPAALFLAYTGAAWVRGMGARHDGGAWCAAGCNAVRIAPAAAPRAGIRAGGCRLLFYVVAGFGGWHLGGKIRPVGRLPKLFHHAAHVFVGRVLFAGQPARLLARRELCQPDFLFD